MNHILKESNVTEFSRGVTISAAIQLELHEAHISVLDWIVNFTKSPKMHSFYDTNNTEYYYVSHDYLFESLGKYQGYKNKRSYCKYIFDYLLKTEYKGQKLMTKDIDTASDSKGNPKSYAYYSVNWVLVNFILGDPYGCNSKEEIKYYPYDETAKYRCIDKKAIIAEVKKMVSNKELMPTRNTNYTATPARISKELLLNGDQPAQKIQVTCIKNTSYLHKKYKILAQKMQVTCIKNTSSLHKKCPYSYVNNCYVIHSYVNDCYVTTTTTTGSSNSKDVSNDCSLDISFSTLIEDVYNNQLDIRCIISKKLTDNGITTPLHSLENKYLLEAINNAVDDFNKKTDKSSIHSDIPSYFNGICQNKTMQILGIVSGIPINTALKNSILKKVALQNPEYIAKQNAILLDQHSSTAASAAAEEESAKKATEEEAAKQAQLQGLQDGSILIRYNNDTIQYDAWCDMIDAYYDLLDQHTLTLDQQNDYDDLCYILTHRTLIYAATGDVVQGVQPFRLARRVALIPHKGNYQCPDCLHIHPTPLAKCSTCGVNLFLSSNKKLKKIS